MIHVYTGNGKGKTTAALGLCARALGAGYKAAFFQFLKGGVESSEEKFFKGQKNILFVRFKQLSPFFDRNSDEKKLVKKIRSDYEKAKKILFSGRFAVVVFDEITYAFRFGALDEKIFIKDVKKAPFSVTVVITGRYASKELIKASDLVTFMKEVKHPYRKNIKARKGVEF